MKYQRITVFVHISDQLMESNSNKSSPDKVEEIEKFIHEFKEKNRKYFGIDNGDEDHMLMVNINYWLWFLKNEEWKLEEDYEQSLSLLKEFIKIIESTQKTMRAWSLELTRTTVLSINKFIECIRQKSIDLSEYSSDDKQRVIMGLLRSFKRAEGFFEWTDVLLEILRNPEIKEKVKLYSWLEWRIRARNPKMDDDEFTERVNAVANYYYDMNIDTDDEDCMEAIITHKRELAFK